MRALPLCFGLLAAFAVPLAAQGGGDKAPRRPELPGGADTCNAYAYYQLGLSRLRGDPEQAAAAFYWTRRLSPDAAVAYYAERVARLLADPGLLKGYFEEDRRTLQSAEVQRIDSLEIRALAIDPFFPRQLDELLIVTYYTNLIHDEYRQHGEEISPLDIQYYVQTELRSLGPETSAWLAFGRGQYRMAADTWAGAVRHRRKDAHLRVWLARALFLLGQLDSARVELDSALATARRSDAERMKYVYDSKVIWQYEVGRIEELQGRDSAAREAYQQALVEDLSFHPAHVRLAYIAMRAVDTTTAVSELQRALEIRENDFGAHQLLGTVLAARRDTAKAAEHLRRAAEIEPWVPQPHLVLGDALRAAGDRDGAVTEYRRFLALAARSNGDAGAVRERLAALGSPAP
jgi:Flp pilus assembly protein TadD